MYYYDPDNKSPRRWAMIATAVYGVLLAGSFALVSFDFSPVTDKPGDTILVDFTEPPVPEPPRPPGYDARSEMIIIECKMRMPLAVVPTEKLRECLLSE